MNLPDPLPGGLHHEDMDLSADPGRDFYRYANGGWLDRHPLPPEEARFGVFEEVSRRNEAILRGLLEECQASGDDDARRLGAWYRSGLDEEAIERRGLEALGDLLERAARVASRDDFLALLPDLHRAGVDALFDVGAQPDPEDPARTLLRLAQGGLGLPERDDYLRDDPEARALRADYRAHVAAMLALSGLPAAAADRAADDLTAFETLLAEGALGAVERRDPLRTNRRLSLDEAERRAPALALPSYARAVAADRAQEVNLAGTEFFEHASRALEGADPVLLGLYARWRTLSAFATALPTRFFDEHFAFYHRRLHGLVEPKPRWKRVLLAANAEIGELLGRRFVARTFPPAAKGRAEDLVRDLVGVFRERLLSRPWMGEETRRRAVEKLDRLVWKIGYPDRWRDHSGLRLVADDWAGNRRRAREHEFAHVLSRVGRPTDRREWHMPPQAVNAYYHPLLNEIVFPAGILQPPFFHPSYDDALNLGAMGAVIGHEITHGFDDAGSRYDARGRIREWWTERDRREFERRAAALVAQFDGVEAAPGARVDGRLTLGENIADLGGLTVAYLTLERRLSHRPCDRLQGFTPQQRFFLAWARTWRAHIRPETLRVQVRTNPHAPPRLRATLPPANLEAFRAAFDLPEDAPILQPRHQRAEIW